MATDAPTPEEQERQQFKQDTDRLLGDPTFRRFIWHLINAPQWCKSDGLATVDMQNHLITDTLRVYFADGRKSIGLELRQFVQALNPKAWMQTLNEAMGMRLRQPSTPKQIDPPKAD